MTKEQNDTMLDNALNSLKNNVTKQTVCAGHPASYTEAVTAYPTGKMLAEVVVDSTDFTLADGDVGGRKLTVAEQLSVEILATGTADHVCLVATATTTKWYVTTCNDASLVDGASVNFPAWDIELDDPA